MSVVTFLFTDIEGSTRRWEADPDAMRVALEAHNEVLRDAVETHAGRSSTTPATGCVRCSIRRGRQSTRRLPPSARWSCRCGWASPPVKPRLRGGDYFGTVLNRTARVMAAGHGGQILLDGATAGLLSGVELMLVGAAAVTGHRQTSRRVPGPGRGPAHRVSTAEDR